MSIIEAIVLGLLQGLTEFIPVSSSGHLLLAQEAFDNGNNLVFDVFLHVGTLLALVVYFNKYLLKLAQNVFKSTEEGKLGRLLLLATIPAGVVGLLFSDYIDDNLRTPEVVIATLASVALLMLYADRKSTKQSKKPISTPQGLRIGLAQTLALIPGVSRSGITITAGMLQGIDRTEAARFSFLLAIPLVAGSALGIVLKDSSGLDVGGWQLLLGFSVSFVSGLLAIKFLLTVISRIGLRPFAYYRLLLAIIVLFVLV